MKQYQDPDFEVIRLQTSVIVTSVDPDNNEGGDINIPIEDLDGDL